MIFQSFVFPDFVQGFLIYESGYIDMEAKLKTAGQPDIPEWDSWGVSVNKYYFQDF